MDRTSADRGGTAGNVVTLEDFTSERLGRVLERARSLVDAGVRDDLAGRTVGMLFFRGSLRTRASLGAAVAQLGGHVIDLTAPTDFWELEYREGRVMDGRPPEHVRDAAAVLSLYCDLLAVRPASEGQSWAVDRKDEMIRGFARHARVPVVNLESALWHPLQALADLLTLHDALDVPPGRPLHGRRLCLSWVHSPTPAPVSVPHSVLVAACRAGLEVRLAHPPGYELDPDVLAAAESAARASGGSLDHAPSLEAGVEGADVVYARSWQSLEVYGDQTVAATRRARNVDWRVDENLMELGRDARLMHAMPIRRNVEATDEVLDGPRSLLLAQAANRLPCQKALLLDLFGL